jgi:hypothetical protein
MLQMLDSVGSVTRQDLESERLEGKGCDVAQDDSIRSRRKLSFDC